MCNISELKNDNDSLKTEIKNINSKLDLQEQLSLNDSVEIVRLP